MASTIQTNRPRKNKFDLSREVKMTGNMGYLYPAFIQDVIPGDSYQVNTQQLIRFSPLLAPMMHNIDFKLDYFFVPYRLVWSEWKDFITGADEYDWKTNTEYDPPSYPKVKINKWTADNYLTKGSLLDYMGVPPIYTSCLGENYHQKTLAGALTGNLTEAENQFDISVLPARAYQLIYHEYFRDQNVGTEFEQHTSSGYIQGAGDKSEQLTLRKSNWEKDYFTSALPFLQRGPEVELPIEGTLPVDFEFNNTSYLRNPNPNINFSGNLTSQAEPNNYTSVNNTGVAIDSSANYSVDLGDSTSVTINELRKATALQRWLELMARAGSRYREQIQAIFGERVPDYTVQVPQYLGGGKTSIMISEILSTYTDSAATGDRPQGDMTGHAMGLGENIGFKQSFTEHGIILGLARIIPKSSYVQGLSKFWQKFDKFDHYFPQFANLGEQEVHNKELFLKGHPTDDDVFGYQQRYAEYKYSFNRVAGDFRDTLNYWELSRRFNQHPNLNQNFVECNPDPRIFAVTEVNEDKIWMNLHHRVNALRPIPYHSNPSLT